MIDRSLYVGLKDNRIAEEWIDRDGQWPTVPHIEHEATPSCGWNLANYPWSSYSKFESASRTSRDDWPVESSERSLGNPAVRIDLCLQPPLNPSRSPFR